MTVSKRLSRPFASSPNHRLPHPAFLLLGLLPLCGGAHAAAQGLQVTYGAKGVQGISFNGTVLEDTTRFSADAFHIFHVQATDLAGNVQSSGQYGWGENNSGESWNAETNTETYTFTWGSLSTQFVQNGNHLDMIVTEVNNAGSGIILDGAEIFPFALHFPQDPKGFSGYSQFAITTTDPGVSVADYGSGVVTSVIPNETVAMYGGWDNAGTATYTPFMTTTAPVGLATFYPHNNLPVQPGTSLSYTVSLRFTPEGTPADTSDANASFAATYPSQMTWKDKRIIGTAYLASSPAGGGNIMLPGGFPTNPRRYFNDPTVDVTNPVGLALFQARMLGQAAADVINAKLMNAQGVITWDIEGEQYPQDTDYVCSPDQIATVSPEMESTISNPLSPFFGQKLDDAYFRTLANAGLRVGLCLRPQAFTLGPNGTASQVNLTGNAAIIANLENKARYANTRWGATLFYVDSTVDANGGTLDPAIFQQLITDLPNLLFIPEESTTRYYAYTAPFYSFIFHTTTGTPAAVYKTYPQAFGANLVNDVNPGTLAQYTPQLTQSVANGDILMGHADYWQANDPTLVSIYAAAGVHAPSTPAPSTPAIIWPTPGAIPYGTAISAAQLDATASVPGSFSYNVAAGTVPGAGTTTLVANFTPANTAAYTGASATVNLRVTQATPAIRWAAPVAIPNGTALSGAQLNATADVPGTFSYNPAPGTTLATGSYTLSATFVPNDATDYTTATATVPVTVLPSTGGQTAPTVWWSAPAAIVYGTPLSGNQLSAASNVPGTFTYSPAAGAVLPAGTTTLAVTFTPSDATEYSTVTRTHLLTVTQGNPAIQWAAPAAITVGTALSGAQLDAAANVPGRFSYTPAAGAVLPAGTTTLTVLFTPTDTTDYTSQSGSVPLVVNAAAAIPASAEPVSILSPGNGSGVSGVITVVGQINLNLDAAGSYLMVDGAEVGWRRVDGPPFLYGLDTTTLSNGSHTLQIWAHDINNRTEISAPVVINVVNSGMGGLF